MCRTQSQHQQDAVLATQLRSIEKRVQEDDDRDLWEVVRLLFNDGEVCSPLLAAHTSGRAHH